MATALATPTQPRLRGPLLDLARRAAAPVAALTVALVAFLAARHLAGEMDPRRVGATLAAMPAWRVGAAFAFTFGSYLLLIGYDLIALATLGVRVPLAVAARASFTSYTLSHNLGFAALTGGPARLRIYGKAGVAPLAVARVVVIAGLAFWGGIIAVTGLCLIATSHTVAVGSLHLSPAAAHQVGIAVIASMALVPAALLHLPALRAPVERLVPIPRASLLLLLLVLGALDLACSSLALLVLLPGLGLGDFPQVYLVFALAIVAGLVTHVPGGLGVFEAIVLASLPIPAGPALAALVAYRAIYYVLPLGLALLLNAAVPARALGQRMRPAIAAVRLVAFEASPWLMGGMTFCGGLVLLLSGALPGLHGRMHALLAILPLPFVNASHLAASLVGTALLLVAPAMVDRLESGMRAARLLFMLGAAFSLAKGLDFEEAMVMLVMAGLLQACAPAFYRRTAGAFSRGSRGWLAAAAVALASATTIGIFAHHHLAWWDADVWWQFALRGDAPRFLRASFAASVLLGAYAVRVLLHRPQAAAGLAHLPDGVFERAAAHSPRSDAALAFTGDKRFLVHPKGDAFLMFRPQGRTWTVMGDPVGPRERWADLVWDLRRKSDASYGRLCFYQLSDAMLPLMVELGLRPIKYGDEAQVNSASFSLAGPRMKNLRNAHARALREGLSLRIVPAADLGGWLTPLGSVSDAWLASRRHGEKSFSLGAFTRSYLQHFDMAVVVRCDTPQRPLAFANLWHSGDGSELSVDLMRHDPEAPPGTMDFLFVELIQLARDRGCTRFNLGLAPLSGVQGGKLAPAWARLANLAFAVDAGAYGFSGLRRYKEKFAPHWQARFIAAPPGLPGLRALVDLATLIATRPGKGA